MSHTFSPERWLEHIEAWEQSSQTQAGYCRTHGFSPHQFSYWKRKLKNKNAVVQQKAVSGFAVAQFETITTSHQALSVTLPDGTILNDIHASNIHVATQLLEALRYASNAQTC